MIACRILGHNPANIWPLKKREFHTVCLRCGKWFQSCYMRK